MDANKLFRVTRFCCTSGMCIDCRAWANGTKRKRVVHADNVTEALAKRMLEGWSRYEPKMEEAPRGETH